MSKKTANNNVKEESFLTDKQTEIQSLQCEIDNFFVKGELFGEELGEILISLSERFGISEEEVLKEYSQFFISVCLTDGDGGFYPPIVESVWSDFIRIKGLEMDIQKLEGGVK